MRSFLVLLPAIALAAGPRYARLAESEGAVEVQLAASSPWMAAERNLPLPESAWLRTGAAARAEVELDDGAVLYLGPKTQLGLADQARLATGQRVTLLSLESGVAILDGAPASRDSLAVAVPGVQVTLSAAARVRAEAAGPWSRVAVLSGEIRFSSPGAELTLRAGQFARVEPANPARFFLDREIPPDDLDQWADERAKARAASADRVLHDAGRAAASLPPYGLADLDAAGRWVQTPALGPVWRPNVEDSWAPFRAGRWLWHETLGFTWVSADPWGWLPYHYGRWTRMRDLGWVWAPSHNGIFKPGDVYWLQSKEDGYIGWGPLAPGEQWPAPDPSILPREFLHANTTYAAFAAGATTIDPAGFARPKDPLAGTVFEAAPPSPPFLASTLEAVRPPVISPGARIDPLVPGTTFDTAAIPPPPAPPPVVVVTQRAPAPAPPPEPEPVAVPVAVPVFWPVIVGQPAPPGISGTPRQTKPSVPTQTNQHPPGGRGLLPPPPGKRFHNALESGLYSLVVDDLQTGRYAKSLEELDGWTQRIRETELAFTRLYFYMLAYNGLGQPDKVLEAAAALFALHRPADDDLQALSVGYLALTNFTQLPHPARGQVQTAKAAARDLLDRLPAASAHRPAAISAADWSKARESLDALARQVLNR